MASTNDLNSVQEQLKKLDKDMSSAFERIRDTEKESAKQHDHIKDLWDAGKSTAKLGVYTARGLAGVESKYKMVAFMDGDLKGLVKTRFTEFQQANKTDKKKEGEQDAAMDDKPKWKVKFMEIVIEWIKEQVKPGGPRAEECGVPMEKTIEHLESLDLGRALDYVFMQPKECPTKGAWCATVSTKGTPEGSQLYALLTLDCPPLYRAKGEGGRSKPANFSCRPDGLGKDRALTAEVATFAGIPVRTGVRGGGSGASASGPSKRRSPQPGRNQRPRQN